MPCIVGFSKACELALTGDVIDAGEARACGLVSRVVPDADLLPAAHAIAERIAVNPPHAVRLTRRDGSGARWEQAFSADGAKTWETNWIMDFHPAREREGAGV